MKAIVVTDPTAGTAGMTLQGRPDPDTNRLASLDGAVAAFNSTERVSGKTIINVRL